MNQMITLDELANIDGDFNMLSIGGLKMGVHNAKNNHAIWIYEKEYVMIENWGHDDERTVAYANSVQDVVSWLAHERPPLN